MHADGCQAIPTRWLDINKGDEKNVQIRSRLVAQETKNRSSIAAGDIAATFAATPPLEAVKMLVSLAKSEQQDYDKKIDEYLDSTTSVVLTSTPRCGGASMSRRPARTRRSRQDLHDC